jgi:hypothetical protein
MDSETIVDAGVIGFLILDSCNNIAPTRGWLTPVVYPHNYAVEGNDSGPEAQAFVITMLLIGTGQ